MTHRKDRKMKKVINEMKLRLPALSVNEAVCRSVISAFMAELDPTVEELGDVRCAVSEAVTNSIVHAYKSREDKHKAFVYISVRLYDNREISVEISDTGCGIEDVELARTPAYTTGGDERSGMGFLVMESFADEVKVKSRPGHGTTVLLRKKLRP